MISPGDPTDELEAQGYRLDRKELWRKGDPDALFVDIDFSLK